MQVIFQIVGQVMSLETKVFSIPLVKFNRTLVNTHATIMDQIMEPLELVKV